MVLGIGCYYEAFGCVLIIKNPCCDRGGEIGHYLHCRYLYALSLVLYLPYHLVFSL
jgi:hypothetical protein